MQKKVSFLIIIAHFMLSSCVQSKDFILYAKDEIQPILYYQNTTKATADEFISLFKKLGSTLKVTRATPNKDKPVVKLEIDPQILGFSLIQDGNQLTIIGGTEIEVRKGIRYFFTTYVGINQFNWNKPINAQKNIFIPLGLRYRSNIALSYLEPYFAENFNEEFRLWNNTNTLEESWALWGHNIGKFIKVTPAMLAIVNGKPNDEQLNFSSEALQNALEAAITDNLENEPQVNKFMIMPYDNEIVCQCEACIKLGNTKTNASPAVYALIEKLSSKFPKALFFSTAYITTETPPAKGLPSNVGVMISTMSFPKGIVLEQSNKVGEIAKKFKDWQKVTKNIYLWDYAINFDNYFDFYPTVSIEQKNLQFYLKNEVKGIFMHGSDEGSFAAFGDLKCYLYAQLYNNPNTDIKAHIKLFLASKYPTLGNLLVEYYTKAEETALKTNKTIDIYGGIKQSVDKYLNQADINTYLNSFILKRNLFTAKEKKASDLLLMSFLFQNLEVLRTNGVSENGYATYQNNKSKVKPEVQKWLTLLKELSVTTGIDIYNESNYSLSTYIQAWHTRIIANPYENLFYKKPFKIISKLDEDYPNSNMLNDGGIGFTDYYNNWLINSAPSLIIEANLAGMEKASVIEMDFLYNKRHKIYPPDKVTVYIGDRKYETSVITKPEDENNVSIVKATIPIKINANDISLRIEINKQTQPAKRLIACDEIIFK